MEVWPTHAQVRVVANGYYGMRLVVDKVTMSWIGNWMFLERATWVFFFLVKTQSTNNKDVSRDGHSSKETKLAK